MYSSGIIVGTTASQNNANSGMKGCQNPHCKNNLRRQRCGSKTSCNSEFEFYAERQDQGKGIYFLENNACAKPKKI